MLRSSVFRLTSLSISQVLNRFSTLEPTATSSAEEVYTHLRNHGANVEKTLCSFRAKIDHIWVNEVLHQFSADHSVLGLRFFIWSGAQPGYKHSGHMYGKACKIFRIHQNPGLILDILESYRAENCSINVKTVQVVLNLCREAKLADEALLVLRKTREFNLGADTIAYNVVIRLFCQKGDMATAEKLMTEMVLVGLCPNMVTFVEMIKGFCSVDRLEDASKLFDEMKKQGCVPNMVVFSTLLDGYCKKGSLESALLLLTGMEERGGDCSPNVVTYSSVIQSFCTHGLPMKALMVLERMIDHGCAPNRVTVRTLLDSLCAEGLMKEADEMIDKVVSGASVSMPDCYSLLVASWMRLEKLEEAERRFREMLNRGMIPDGATCNMILLELCSKGRPLNAFMILKEIEKARYLAFIGPNAYSALLMGLWELKHREEAIMVARLMLDGGIRFRAPDAENVVKYLKDSGEIELMADLT